MSFLKNVGKAAEGMGEGYITMSYWGSIIFLVICSIIFIVTIGISVSSIKRKYTGKCSGRRGDSTLASAATPASPRGPVWRPSDTPVTGAATDLDLLDKGDCCNTDTDCSSRLFGSTCLNDPHNTCKDKNISGKKWAWIFGAIFFVISLLIFIFNKAQLNYSKSGTDGAKAYKQVMGGVWGADLISGLFRK